MILSQESTGYRRGRVQQPSRAILVAHVAVCLLSLTSIENCCAGDDFPAARISYAYGPTAGVAQTGDAAFDQQYRLYSHLVGRYLDEQEFEKARDRQAHLTQIATDRLGPDHWKTKSCRFRLESLTRTAAAPAERRETFARAWPTFVRLNVRPKTRVSESDVEPAREVHAVWSDVLGPQDYHTLYALRTVAIAELAAGDPANAHASARSLIDAVQATYGANHPAYGEALLLLGAIDLERELYEAAERELIEGLQIYNQLVSGPSDQFAHSMINLASAQFAMHQLARAETVLEHVLTLCRQLDEPLHEVRATQLLAEVYSQQGKFEDAVLQYTRFLETANALLLPLEGAVIARCLERRADSLRQLGRIEEANRDAQLARSVREREEQIGAVPIGGRIPNTEPEALSTDLNSIRTRSLAMRARRELPARLGAWYDNLFEDLALGHFDARHRELMPIIAYAYHAAGPDSSEFQFDEHQRRILKRVLTFSAEKQATVRQAFQFALEGQAATVKGDFETSSELWTRCGQRFDEIFGVSHFSVHALQEAAVAHIALKKFTAAKPLVARVLEIHKPLSGDRIEPYYCIALVHFGQCESHFGNLKEAEQAYVTGLERFLPGPGQVEAAYWTDLSLDEILAECCLGLAEVYNNVGKSAQAQPVAELACIYAKEQIGEKLRRYVRSEQELARSYFAQNELAEAAKAYQRLIRFVDSLRQPAPDKLVIEILDGYAECLRRQGHTTEAEKQAARARRLREKPTAIPDRKPPSLPPNALFDE